MEIKSKALILAVFFIIFCSERNRINQFDVGNPGFAAPPPCYTFGEPVYDSYGYLVAVCIWIGFTDPMPRTLSIDHKFFVNGNNVLDFGYSAEQGSKGYGFQISYGGAPFPVGTYCLKSYWGEFGYAAFPFSVVLEDGTVKFSGKNYIDEAAEFPPDLLELEIKDRE